MEKGRKYVLLFIIVIAAVIVGSMDAYVSRAFSVGKDDESITFRAGASYQYSAEGANLVGGYGIDGEIKYLNVDIFGEMGRRTYEYTFEDDYIIFTYQEIDYSEPFYLSDGEIKIKEISNHKYIMFQQEMYEIVDGADWVDVSWAQLSKEQSRYKDFINELDRIGSVEGEKIPDPIEDYIGEKAQNCEETNIVEPVQEPEAEAAPEDEPEQQETKPEKEYISEKELGRLWFWFERYKQPLKGADAELLQLKGNLELDMDEACYPELREALREYREQAWRYSGNPDYRVIVHRADKRALSFLERKDENSGYRGYNFDPETGRVIEISDVVNDTGRLSAIIENQLKYNYPDADFKENLTEQIEQLWGNDAAVTWTISYQGLCFYFSSEELTAQEGDVLQAMVFYKNTPDLFQEKYLQVPETYAIELDDFAPFLYDLDLDGGYDWIEVFHYQNDEQKDTGVQVNHQKCTGKYDTATYFEETRRVYLLHTAENKNYIAFYERGDLDFFGEYAVYAVDRDKIEYLGCEDIYLGDGRITDLDAVRIESGADPLYMLLLEKDYSIAENGFFETNDAPDYYCASDEDFGYQTFITLRDLKLPLVDAFTGDFLGTEISVPQGTYMVPLRTGQGNWCDFLLSNGQVCRIEFDASVAECGTAEYKDMRVVGGCMSRSFY